MLFNILLLRWRFAGLGILLGKGGLLSKVCWSLFGLVWLIWFVVSSLLVVFCWFRFTGSGLLGQVY